MELPTLLVYGYPQTFLQLFVRTFDPRLSILKERILISIRAFSVSTYRDDRYIKHE